MARVEPGIVEDGQRPIAKLLKESLAACKVVGLDQVGEEPPPPYDSQANGAVESAVKQVRVRLRTMVVSRTNVWGSGFLPVTP